MPSHYADLEIGLHYRDEASYSVEMRFSMPDSDADIRPPEHAPLVEFDRQAYLSLELNAEAYGARLAQDLFTPPVRDFYSRAQSASRAADKGLRVRLWVDPRAPDLHRLRWETLQDPADNTPLFTNENSPFARYLSSLDWRPVRLRPKGELRALVVVANPTDLEQFQLAPIDAERELDLARQNIGPMHMDVLPVRGERATLVNLLARLRDGYDIVYLACHGTFRRNTNQPFLWLENDAGLADRVEGGDVMAQLRTLNVLPRLMVLASCQSAGAGEGEVLLALGPRLAEAGVPAVLAQQGNVSLALVRHFMPIFFRELQRDGQIDRAMSAARSAVWREHSDWWMPTLFMRLKSGRLWYTPGFGDARKGATKLPAVIRNIRRGRCTPIIGPGLAESYVGSIREVAGRWADQYRYPMSPHERESLPQVAQYLTIHQDPRFPFDELEESLIHHLRTTYAASLPETLLKGRPSLTALLETVGAQRREQDEAEPHRALAELPLPIYITANQDTLLEAALKAVGREPRTFLCPWNEYIEQNLDEYTEEPTPEKPLVFHLFGSWEQPDSIVLTEDNYFDFLIGVTSNKDLIPEQVRLALSDSSLLFLGFQTEGWDFRVLYRAILSQPGSNRRSQYAQIAAQLEPEDGRILEPQGARLYLEEYFGKGADIDIFWGSPQEFLAELMRGWRNSR